MLTRPGALCILTKCTMRGPEKFVHIAILTNRSIYDIIRVSRGRKRGNSIVFHSSALAPLLRKHP